MTTGDAPTVHPCTVGGTTIGVVGGGTVGRATARAWLEHAREVRVYDVLRQRRTHPLPEVLAADVVFICLPEGEVEWLFEVTSASVPAGLPLVIRSTVPVGTTWRLARRYGLARLVHSPEFLTARCADVDARVPAQLVVGYPGQARADHPVVGLYRERFPGVPVREVTSDESETAKLATNAFFAVKVAFFNELHEGCGRLGVDWAAVREVVLGDGRISPYHTRVPGPDGACGFGGACLPKDAAELARCLEEYGLAPDVTRAALARNGRDRGRRA